MPWVGYLVLMVAVAAALPMLWVAGQWLLMRRLGTAVPSVGHTLPVFTGSAGAGPRSVAQDDVARSGPPSWTPCGQSDQSQHGGAQPDAARLRALAVGFNGRQYTFGGYRYDRLEDAVAYAELLRSRSRLGAGGDTASPAAPVRD